ncbi:lactate utilization protein C [Sphaerisporangium sp. NPDC051011]|uniref:LutC/YkgG family protein n=1 Tax=Sphaerisporangium sp. NPDC051011 TaxID=3155792 RepID=UPI0033F8C72D
MSSRERVLARVRAAVAGAPRVEVPRDYRTTGPEAGRVERFADRVRDYKAVVHVVPAAEVATTVADALSRRGARRIVVPDGLPEGWLSAAAPLERLADDPPLTAALLDAADGVVTGCAVAVAETGTIVLDAGPGQGRRALTLVPDYHLCVVPDERIVPSVPEAVARLDPSRPLTWISGPSATSDIELNRVEGVHGPRTLEVIIAV